MKICCDGCTIAGTMHEFLYSQPWTISLEQNRFFWRDVVTMLLGLNNFFFIPRVLKQYCLNNQRDGVKNNGIQYIL